MRAHRYTDNMYRFMETVLDEIGPRESCSENERRLGQKLVDTWQQLGLQTHTERFSCHPHAFLGFIPFSVLCYLAATIAYWWSPLLAFLFAGSAFAMIFFELLRYRECVDRLFPQRHGENVVAVMPPTQEVHRRVVVSAHQDSAYEFNLWFFLKSAAIPVMIIAFAAPLFLAVGALVMSLTNGMTGEWYTAIGYTAMGLYPIVGLNLFFHTFSVVPGAMDDLAGISVLVGVAQALTEQEDAGPTLQHTEVVLLAASSEEAGLRGAKRYVEAHKTDLTTTPSYGIFVDGVYDERHLTVVHRELFTGARHDPRLVQLAKDVAAAHGWPIRSHMIPLGASDATAFSVAGIPAVCLLCQDATRLVPNYHTRLDTIEHIRPQSLAVSLQMVLDMIQHIDTHGLE